LASIDRLIASAMPEDSRSLLDVGAGDGTRARRIAQARQIPELTLLEPSRAMQGEPAAGARVLTLRAQDLHSVEGEFDVITCLWNVLGHVFPKDARIEVFRQFARLLSPDGRVFIDVSHRYNVRHYGIRFRGDVVVDWDVEGIKSSTVGHVFTHGEIRSLCRSAGLTIEQRYVVDYATGQRRRWAFEGHLLYVLCGAANSGRRRVLGGAPA
jgi:2-polyprenyl-3-methyl-5-hydroxy-6-metoxy-1,4-benzoquinol methylase